MRDHEALKASLTSNYPQEIIYNAVQLFGPRLAVLTRFTPADMVLLHMLVALAPDVPVLTLDTGVDTAEIVSRLKLNLVPIRASAGSQAALFNRSLTGYDAWLVGQTASAHKVGPVLAHTLLSNRVRIAPLARWNNDTIQSYLQVYQLPGAESITGSAFRPENPPARCQL